jgi:hypothetical protein
MVQFDVLVDASEILWYLTCAAAMLYPHTRVNTAFIRLGVMLLNMSFLMVRFSPKQWNLVCF